MKQMHLYPRGFALSLHASLTQKMVLQLQARLLFFVTKDCAPPIPHVSFSLLSSLFFYRSTYSLVTDKLQIKDFYYFKNKGEICVKIY